MLSGKNVHRYATSPVKPCNNYVTSGILRKSRSQLVSRATITRKDAEIPASFSEGKTWEGQPETYTNYKMTDPDVYLQKACTCMYMHVQGRPVCHPESCQQWETNISESGLLHPS